MALTFPSSPAIGDIYPLTPVTGLPQYKWDGITWIMVGTLINPQIYVSDAVPPNPVDNALWWSSTDGVLYLRYWDGDSRAWVQCAPSAADYAALQAYTDAVSKRNRIVNGAMMVSQENGAVAGTASGYYPVDQFYLNFSHDGAQSAVQYANPTPGGSPNRIRVTVTTADASLASGQHASITTRVEGSRVADFRFGSTSAKTITLRFGVRLPAGTYCIGLNNGAFNRSIVGEYTISAAEANTDVIKTVTFAGDQIGTWVTDNTTGFVIFFALGAGSSLTTPIAQTWVTGNYFGTPTSSNNFMATVGNVFELFDVDLFEGTVPRAYVVPDYATELALCYRYYEAIPLGTSFTPFGMAQVASAASAQALCFFSRKRIAPLLITSAVADFALTTANSATTVANNVTLGNSGPSSAYVLVGLPANVLVAGNATQFVQNNTAAAKFHWNARM
jgi:hypothetical protein